MCNSIMHYSYRALLLPLPIGIRWRIYISTYEENCNTLSNSIFLEWTWKVKYPELRRNLKGMARGNSTKKLIHIIQEKQRGR